MDLNALRAALAASPDTVPLLLMVAKLEEDHFGMKEARQCLDRVLAIELLRRLRKIIVRLTTVELDRFVIFIIFLFKRGSSPPVLVTTFRCGGGARRFSCC